MEYTKGDWKTHKNYMGTWTVFTEDAHIADVDRHFNAHVIASAPDLYEALSILASSVTVMGYFKPEIQAKIKKALAKAEGK